MLAVRIYILVHLLCKRHTLVNFRSLNDHLSGKELFIRFTARALRTLLSIYVFNYFHFSFEGRMWDLILSVPDHCLSFYFKITMYRIVRYIVRTNETGYFRFARYDIETDSVTVK